MAAKEQNNKTIKRVVPVVHPQVTTVSGKISIDVSTTGYAAKFNEHYITGQLNTYKGLSD